MKSKKIKLLAILLATGMITINCLQEEKRKNNAVIGLSDLVSGAGTISPTAGEDVCDGKNGASPTTVTGDITSNTTWNGAVKLSGTVTVKNNATLTVLPGTVVLGETGSSLFVTQGSKLVAEGTVASPICFTSAKAVGSRAPGDWGGIVLIGNAQGTRSSTTEGINKLPYGSGSNNTDSSGSLKYVIIEFSGNEVAAGDELNGLSLYTVGSGTTLEYVQAHRGLDDGFEWWGGKVSGKHLIVTGGMDDDFDMDEGFGGELQYLIGVKYPTACGGTPSTDPHGMEMDGMHSGNSNCTAGPGCTNPTVKNYVLIGQQVNGGRAQRHRESLKGNFSEGIVYNFQTGITCENNAGIGDGNTASTFSNILADKNLSNSAGCSGTVTKAITKLPITSLGAIDATNCGNGANKPDFNTIAEYATASTGAIDPSAPNWWANWTVYRSK
jgi:hypothetical protein